MPSHNRLAKYFEDAAKCQDCGTPTPEAESSGFAALEQAVGLVIAACRAKKWDDRKLGYVITLALAKVIAGGRNAS
jgi:hypothetical protein